MLMQDLLSFQNESGNLTATGFRWQDANTLVITFAAQPISVQLFMVLSPNILNLSGVPLDQDDDRIPGESTDDQYLATLSVDNKGPFVINTEPGLIASAPIDRFVFHFSEQLDPATVSLADISVFTGPKGVNLKNQLTNILVGDKSITVFFQEQSVSGQYSISIGPNITDASGNAMDQDKNGIVGQSSDNFTLSFTLQSIDLSVVQVANPQPTVHGNTMSLSWQVKNEGNDAANGLWWASPTRPLCG